MACARGARATQVVVDEIAAWVARELARPEVKKPTPHQRHVIGQVLANHHQARHRDTQPGHTALAATGGT